MLHIEQARAARSLKALSVRAWSQSGSRSGACFELRVRQLKAGQIVHWSLQMTNPLTFAASETIDLKTDETVIHLRRLGAGPALLLLHGFPETHLMWRDVAPRL